MIEPVGQAIHRLCIYYVVLLATMVSLSILCFVLGKYKTKSTIFGIALIIMAAIILVTSAFPFLIDCSKSNVLITECIYQNLDTVNAKTPSSLMGIYTVKLLVNGESFTVTTVPFSRTIFPPGEFRVRAYYTEHSKRLLYIEMLD